MTKTRFKHAKNRKVQYLDENGLWKSTGCDTLAEAKIWFDKHVNTNHVTLKSVVDDMFSRNDTGSFRWLCKKTKKENSASWWVGSDVTIRCRILPYFGNLDIREISPSLIQDWYFNLKKIDSNEELADESKNKILNLMSTILKWAVYNRWIDENPVDKVLRIKAESNKRGKFSTEEMEQMFPEEINAAVQFWGSLKWASFFFVMKDTGWRPGEVAGLSLEGFFPEKKGIYTNQSVDPITAKVKKSIKTSNNGYDYKIGILSDFTIKILKLHIEQDGIKSGLIFKVNNEPIKINCTRLHYKRCMRRNGIDITNRPPYSIRTTFMSKMANVYDEDTVKELMGHKQWHTCYDQRTPEELISKISKKVN